jgi:sarcosine oxidase subunit gamma
MPDSVNLLNPPRSGDSRARAAAPMARFSLRGPESFAAEGLTALRLGPDEFLLLLPEGESPPLVLPKPYSLVDISHRQIGIVLEGPAAADMLNAGCPLDLDERAFPVGMATRTLFMKADIVLWRVDHQKFHIEVWRSFAPYVWSLLEVIGQEYT